MKYFQVPSCVSMPHAALWVVQHLSGAISRNEAAVSMPHAALWVVQPNSLHKNIPTVAVSMPHAALWVVQRRRFRRSCAGRSRFNAARGFVGGATRQSAAPPLPPLRFQCRTRLCGWCNCIARSPCPPRGKKPFWKVSENLSVLTENM